MVEAYLISQDDVTTFFAMAEIPQGRFDPHIIKAQDLDLRPVLNDALYYDFITKYNSTGDPMYAAYQTLLNGGAYTYSGQTIEYPGIKPMLCSFTLARFLPMNPINVTRYGVVNKVNPQSAPVDQSQIKYAVDSLRADAVKYQGDVIKFLSNNTATYPLYNTMPMEAPNRSGYRISSSSNSVRRRTFGWYNGVYYP